MDSTVKTYHRLMPHRVSRILIISSPYDAFVMQEDGGVMEQVFTSYRDISLTSTPKFTVVSTAKKALYSLAIEKFDLVIIIAPKLLGMDAVELGREIKKQSPDLPVVLLAHGNRGLPEPETMRDKCIDKVFIWLGNRDIMWAILKWAEDRLNVTHDTAIARVRVIIMIEDSPFYYSSLLSILYKAVLQQTQAIIADTLNEEHRLWMLRARTKILLAKDFEEAIDLYTRYKPYLLGVFSDTEFPRGGQLDPEAGIIFLEKIKAELPELPMLLLSSQKNNAEGAGKISVHFQDKNSPSLHLEIRKFLLNHLGFGDFIFRLPDGTEVARASNLHALENALHDVPDESLQFHSVHNHFSNWLMARSEIFLSAKFRAAKASNFESISEIRHYLIRNLHQKRMLQQRGVVASFKAKEYDSEYEFLKIGEGSLGGKARGLAFMSRYLQENLEKIKHFHKIRVSIPKALIIATDLFDRFIEENNLQDYSERSCSDAKTAQRFLNTKLPASLESDLRAYLRKTTVPIAIRSSSLLEDSKEEPYAGLYATYMLANNDADLDVRLAKASRALRMVYASVFYEGPKAFSRATQHRTEEEKMAVLIQPITGRQYKNYFYPAISGTAQSYNFYPVGHMRSNEGIAHISLGLGKIVVEGGQTLRFSPQYPQSLPQFSSVDDILDNAQQNFYALKMRPGSGELSLDQGSTLEKRDIFESRDEEPVRFLASTYFPDDHRIRDMVPTSGIPVMTFANILKYERYPVADFLAQLLKIARKGFGCDIEIEFAINLPTDPNGPANFVLLQARPMTTPYQSKAVELTSEEMSRAICYSTSTLGLGSRFAALDIIYVKPNSLTSRDTVRVAGEIAKINAMLAKEEKKYLLVGPGRWGSSDHCLGIPVSWPNISEVSAIIETRDNNFKADPSQGTHFFQNITSQRIIYFTVHNETDFINWDWLKNQEQVSETEFIRHVRSSCPLLFKINGQKNHGLLLCD